MNMEYVRYISIHEYTQCALTHTHTHLHTQAYCTYIEMHIHTCAHTYTPAHTHTHSYAHAHMRTSVHGRLSTCLSHNFSSTISDDEVFFRGLNFNVYANFLFVCIFPTLFCGKYENFTFSVDNGYFKQIIVFCLKVKNLHILFFVC